MKMVTTCPACGTAFRIHRDQIDARAGQVRCGHCSVVFDARAHLQMEPELPPPMDEAVVEHDTVVIPIEVPPIAEEQAPEPVEEHSPAREEAPEEEGEPPTLEELGFYTSPPIRNRRWVWGTAAVCLFSVLVLQLLYHFRGEVALYAPSLQPLLRDACLQAGCTLPLPQRDELVSIESNEMQFDRSKSEVLTLSAILRNRAPFDQAYPAIELTLTDDAKATLTRRVLRPREYLDEARRKTVAFKANSEIEVKLYIDATGLNATDYRMAVFYGVPD